MSYLACHRELSTYLKQVQLGAAPSVRWAKALAERRPVRLTTVVLANKTARIELPKGAALAAGDRPVVTASPAGYYDAERDGRSRLPRRLAFD